jgi:formylglycine-generating enzyme required for sulfatase activity
MVALTTRKRPGRNQYYPEPLAEGVLPLQMMQIPGGTFLMGSPKDEEERTDAEGPQHEVTLTPFFMAAYPVTQAQWRFVATLPKVDRDLDADPSHFKGDLRPVERVSWHDAVEFCARLAAHTQRAYRLPSEAEWEYACRAGTTTPFHFGPTLSTDYANYDGANEKYGAYGSGTRGEHRGETTPVNQFEGANAFGLYDMHGNVLEWCQDTWHRNYEGAPTDGSAWIEGGDISWRVRRGGSWNFNPRYCRSAYRSSTMPASASTASVFGFVVLPPGSLRSPLPSYPLPGA